MVSKLKSNQLFGVDDKTAHRVVDELFEEFVSDGTTTIMEVAKSQGFPETHSEELYRAFVFGMMVQRNETDAWLADLMKTKRK